MRLVWVYITATDMEQARAIGRRLVEARLAACANVVEGMESLYWWGGVIQQGREVMLIVKTRESLLTKVVAEVKAAHSYTCPCVVALPILDGNPDYLQWVIDETG